jgi:hypothetical protein
MHPVKLRCGACGRMVKLVFRQQGQPSPCPWCRAPVIIPPQDAIRAGLPPDPAPSVAQEDDEVDEEAPSETARARAVKAAAWLLIGVGLCAAGHTTGAGQWAVLVAALLAAAYLGVQFVRSDQLPTRMHEVAGGVALPLVFVGAYLGFWWQAALATVGYLPLLLYTLVNYVRAAPLWLKEILKEEYGSVGGEHVKVTYRWMREEGCLAARTWLYMSVIVLFLYVYFCTLTALDTAALFRGGLPPARP